MASVLKKLGQGGDGKHLPAPPQLLGKFWESQRDLDSTWLMTSHFFRRR